MNKKIPENQLTIWNMFTETREPSGVPVRLSAGDVIYLLKRADITPYRVLDESWLCGEQKQNRGYRLQKTDSSIYGVALNSEENLKWFRSFEAAENAAALYLEQHADNILLAETIKPQGRPHCFQFTRECDGYNMQAFYVDIGNDLLYAKQFYTFHHIIPNTKKSIKKFMEKLICNAKDLSENEFQLDFKNMYRCKPDSDWMYAEAGYGFY